MMRNAAFFALVAAAVAACGSSVVHASSGDPLCVVRAPDGGVASGIVT